MFRVLKDGQIFPAFVIRYGNVLRSFLNVCPHMGLRLNRESGVLFHREKNYLFCRAHGAGFEPVNGKGIIGPCNNLSLISLKVEERKGTIYFPEQDYKYYAGI